MGKDAKYTELISNQSEAVETLFKIYQKSKYNARVYYMNENSDLFIKHRLGIFDEENGDFSVVYFKKKYGISKTNKIYNRESRVYSIIKKGNKFYYKRGSSIKPLIFANIMVSNYTDLLIEALVSRVPWCRYISENRVLQSISFNTIYSKKLFSLDKALRYEYKLPLPSAKLLHELRESNREYSYTAHYIKYYVDYMDNVENLHNRLPSYDFGIFYDTLKMAKVLDKKVNCSWSAKRLKSVHDEWSEKITDIVFTEGNRDMNINILFLDFALFSGYKILTTTKEMCVEGRRNNHCVATYINKVDNGNCAIYCIDGYTLELNKQWVNNYKHLILTINQFRGYKNCDAPVELYNAVENMVAEFNLKMTGVTTEDINISKAEGDYHLLNLDVDLF